MRAEVPGLRTPYPLSTLVPAYLQEEDFVVRMTGGLDDVLAPAIAVLDCLDAYVDPLLAPPDFVTWLGSWVGAPLDDNWPDDRRRWSVLAACELHRLRGTVPGLRSLVSLATGGEVTVTEPGGVERSGSPTGPEQASGSRESLVVTVAVDDPGAVRRAALEELVDAAKPAHVPHVIEVVPR
jgi:phage tail-like protein